MLQLVIQVEEKYQESILMESTRRQSQGRHQRCPQVLLTILTRFLPILLSLAFLPRVLFFLRLLQSSIRMSQVPLRIDNVPNKSLEFFHLYKNRQSIL